MDLSILVEIVVHYLLIGGMTYLSHRDGFSMVSALVCMAYTLDITYDKSRCKAINYHDALVCIGFKPILKST